MKVSPLDGLLQLIVLVGELLDGVHLVLMHTGCAADHLDVGSVCDLKCK